MSGATLCIIGGSPRSGTRNFADLVSAHPQATLFGEVGIQAVARAQEAMNALTQYHKTERTQRKASGIGRLKGYEAPHLALATLALHAKTPALPFTSRSFKKGVVGFKTPQIERKWRGLNRLLGDFDGPKHFFFCIRHLDQNFLSLHSRGWRQDVEEYISRLKPLFISILEFHDWNEKKRAGWGISALSLNSYISAEDPVTWLSRNLYSRIHLEAAPETIDKFIGATRNRNATVVVTGKPPRKTLTAQERTTLERDRELAGLARAVRQTLGAEFEILSAR